MAALLPNPEPQFADANGKPYAGGTLLTYVPGTTTFKTTWNAPDQSSANTNPIVLDSAGRVVMFGDGEYRLILKDVAGNQIWDQPSSTLVSAAMAPVIIAPTIAEAVRLLGIQALIDAEAAARAAADAAEANARAAADAAETARAEAAEAAETARAEAAEAALSARIAVLEATPTFKSGYATTDASGHARVTFPVPFPNAGIAAVVLPVSAGFDNTDAKAVVDAAGLDVWLSFPSTSAPFSHPQGVMGFYYMCTGT